MVRVAVATEPTHLEHDLDRSSIRRMCHRNDPATRRIHLVLACGVASLTGSRVWYASVVARHAATSPTGSQIYCKLQLSGSNRLCKCQHRYKVAPTQRKPSHASHSTRPIVCSSTHSLGQSVPAIRCPPGVAYTRGMGFARNSC